MFKLGSETKKDYHITSGSSLKNILSEYVDESHIFAWNEAMCTGETCESIFSDEFITKRVECHNTIHQDYIDVVYSQIINSLSSNHLYLWFGDDMFCQINMLTVLAWLEQNNYQGQVTAVIIDDHKLQLISCTETKLGMYHKLYKRVLIGKHPVVDSGVVLLTAINNYLSYEDNDGELVKSIKLNKGDPDLVSKLLINFAYLGLGDLQYQQLIDRVNS